MRSFLYSIVSQIHLVFLGLFIWRKPTTYSAELQTFSYYNDNQDTFFMKVMILAALMEMAAVHMLLLKLAPEALSVALALSIATILTILGVLVSWRDNPIVIDQNTIKLRWGLFRRHSLSPSQILSVKTGAVGFSQPRSKNHMVNAIFAEPNVTISIKPGCLNQGRTQIDHVSLVADAPKALVETINGLLQTKAAS